MIKIRLSTCLWLVFYLLIAIAPLIGGIFNMAHGRGFWLNFSIALGFVALSMFAAQFVLVSRIRVVSVPVGMDGVIALHKYLAYAATAFALIHPVILFALDEKYWRLLDISTSPLRAKWAVLATVALILLVSLSIWHKKIALRYPFWKSTHWILALIVVAGGLAHAEGVNYYLNDPSEQMIWLAMSLVFILIAVWVRLIKPLLNYRRRWQVAEIHEFPPGVTNLTLQPASPAAYGPHGFRFKPGQFVWIMAGRSPFALTYHPFSLTSSAEQRQQISLSIKAYDGFSSNVARLRAGDSVYVDGPHGTFVLEEDDDQTPLVLIAGGVGVTPFISMLATLADRSSRRACHLWLASRDEGQVTCAQQIQALQKRLNLTVRYVFSRSASGPSGQRMDLRFIEAHQPPGAREAVYYICGPLALMDSVEASLADLGVPRHHIHSERFDMV